MVYFINDSNLLTALSKKKKKKVLFFLLTLIYLENSFLDNECVCTRDGEGNGNPLQYSCLENSHEQRSLAGYSQRKDSDTTEWLLTARHSILRTRAFSYITTVQYDNIIVSTTCRSYSDFSVSVRSFIEEESPRSGITFICQNFFVLKWSCSISLSFMTVTVLKTAVHFEKCLSIWIHLCLWN